MLMDFHHFRKGSKTVLGKKERGPVKIIAGHGDGKDLDCLGKGRELLSIRWILQGQENGADGNGIQLIELSDIDLDLRVGFEDAFRP